MNIIDREYWNPEIETMDRDKLYELQCEKLSKQMKHVYQNSPYYRKKFDEAGITGDDIKTPEDLVKVPFLNKEDYESEQKNNPPYGGMLCVPENQLSRFWTTSGTTGKPRMFATTTKDYIDYLESAARVLWAGGVRPGMREVVLFGHGHWIGMWGVFDAAWYKVGAQIIPIGGYDTKGRIEKIIEFKVNVICGTPTYMTYLAETADRMGIDARKLGIKAILVAGEPSSPTTRKNIETLWGARTTDFFGMTENYSYHGVDCYCQDGFHFWEDRGVTEIIDPDTGKVLPDGELGELVYTNICSESMPCIRLRTGDITSMTREKCSCGRTHVRVKYILGRREQIVKIKDLNVYPRVIEEIIRSTTGLGSEYRIVFERPEGKMDQMKLQIEPLPELDSKMIDNVVADVKNKVKQTVGITSEIEVLKHGTLEISEAKAKRIVDLRGNVFER